MAFLRTHRHLIAYAIVILALLVGIIRVEILARDTRSALCSFKGDLEKRSEFTENFIAQHPDGIPGISRADLDRSLTNQRATIASLASLEC